VRRKIASFFFFLWWRAPQQMLRTHRSLETYCATKIAVTIKWTCTIFTGHLTTLYLLQSLICTEIRVWG
jgi:hypothetical protein